jgi:hypothetical protein
VGVGAVRGEARFEDGPADAEVEGESTWARRRRARERAERKWAGETDDAF